jgi:hypothetical protein
MCVFFILAKWYAAERWLGSARSCRSNYIDINIHRMSGVRRLSSSFSGALMPVACWPLAGSGGHPLKNSCNNTIL